LFQMLLRGRVGWDRSKEESVASRRGVYSASTSTRTFSVWTRWRRQSLLPSNGPMTTATMGMKPPPPRGPTCHSRWSMPFVPSSKSRVWGWTTFLPVCLFIFVRSALRQSCDPTTAAGRRLRGSEVFCALSLSSTSQFIPIVLDPGKPAESRGCDIGVTANNES